MEFNGASTQNSNITANCRDSVWAYWDKIKHERFKLRWGFFRPSFKLAVLEPLVVRLLGPRGGN